MCRDLADQRDVFFFFYLAVISYANSTCKVKTGEDVDERRAWDDTQGKIGHTLGKLSTSRAYQGKKSVV